MTEHPSRGPGAAALRRGAHTPEELAWWKQESRTHRLRIRLGSSVIFGLLIGLAELVREGQFAGFVFDRPHVVRLVVQLAISALSGFFVAGTMFWWMSEGALRDAQIRRRRIRDALLAPADDPG